MLRLDKRRLRIGEDLVNMYKYVKEKYPKIGYFQWCLLTGPETFCGNMAGYIHDRRTVKVLPFESAKILDAVCDFKS